MINRIQAKQNASNLYYQGTPVGAVFLAKKVFSLIPYARHGAILGMRCFSLAMIDGKHPKSSHIFSGFDNALKSLGLYYWILLWTFLWQFVPSIVFSIISGLILRSGSSYLFGASINFLLQMSRVLWLNLLWFAISIAIAIYNMARFGFAHFVLADHPDMPVMECLNRSKELVKGHTWEIVVVYLSFIGWYILGLITMDIVNVLWTIPYWNLTIAGVYRQLSPAAANNSSGPQNAPYPPPRPYSNPDNTVREAGLRGISGMYMGQMFLMRENESFMLGRDAANAQIVINENAQLVSRTHCQVAFDQRRGTYIVTDYSKNGTFLADGTRLPLDRPYPVPRGAEIYLGDRNNGFRLI